MQKSIPVFPKISSLPHVPKLPTHKERLLPKKKKKVIQENLQEHKEPLKAKQTPQKHSSEEAIQGDLSAHFLSRYFKEMAQLSTLNAEQEISMAKNLKALERSQWEQLLLFFPIHGILQAAFKKTSVLRPAELVNIQKKMAGIVLADSLESASKEALALAKKIQTLDMDRLLITQALLDLKKWKETQKNIEPAWMKSLLSIEKIHHEAEVAKHEFVQSNLRLVVALARRFYQGRMSLPDLIQEGNIGLIKAVERFDYLRGYRFSTYASWWIRHSISRALADKGRAVRVPVHMIDTYYRLMKSRTMLSNQLGRQPSNEELSKAADVSMDRIEKMNGYLLEHSVSIDQTISDDDHRQVLDFMEDDSKENQPMGQLIDKTIQHEVEELFADLAPMEADVLRQRFGLDSPTEEEQTLKEIGKRYRLSRERIRQIQEQALSKIRKVLIRKDLI